MFQRAFRQADSLGCRGHLDIADLMQLGRFHFTGIGRGQRRGEAARGHFQRVVLENNFGRNTEWVLVCEI